MKQRVIAVTGLSGVGKSTLLRKLASVVSFQHLQASALIREARRSVEKSITLDELRSVDLDENQNLLIDGFARAVDGGATLIVLDAHTVIEREDKLVLIRPHVFGAIGIISMIYLTEDSTEIVKRRIGDKGRQRSIKNAEQLRCIQSKALRHAKQICRVLDIPISIFSSEDFSAIADLLRSYVAASSVK